MGFSILVRWHRYIESSTRFCHEYLQSGIVKCQLSCNINRYATAIENLHIQNSSFPSYIINIFGLHTQFEHGDCTTKTGCGRLFFPNFHQMTIIYDPWWQCFSMNSDKQKFLKEKIVSSLHSLHKSISTSLATRETSKRYHRKGYENITVVTKQIVDKPYL